MVLSDRVQFAGPTILPISSMSLSTLPELCAIRSCLNFRFLQQARPRCCISFTSVARSRFFSSSRKKSERKCRTTPASDKQIKTPHKPTDDAPASRPHETAAPRTTRLFRKVLRSIENLNMKTDFVPLTVVADVQHVTHS